MKRNLLQIVIAMSVFISCKKTNNSPTIVGKWHYGVDSTSIYTNGILTHTTSIPSDSRSSNYFDQYNSDGTGLTSAGVSRVFNYTVLGNNLTINIPVQAGISSAFSVNAVVEKLTENEMELVYETSVTSNNVTTNTVDNVFYSKF